MAPSLTGWLIEKELYLEFRWRTREVLEAAPVEALPYCLGSTPYWKN